MKKTIIVSILLLLGILFEISSQTQDKELAHLYAHHAWNAYVNEKWPEFRDLTLKGFEYDELNPDLLTFRGLESRRAGHYQEASDWFSKAYYSGFQPEQVNTIDILGWLFEVQYRLGYDEDLVFLYFSSNELMRDNPDILFYTVLSLQRQGNFTKAIELAAEGVYRFQDQRFLILLSSWTPESYYPGILSEYIRRQGILYPDLMARTILSPECKNSRSLAALYLEQYQDLNSWYFREILFELPSEAGAVLDFTDSERVWPLLSLQMYIQKNPDIGSLMHRITRISLDSTGDGIADFFLRKSDNELEWMIDPDQDGIIDSHLKWNESNQLMEILYQDVRSLHHLYYYNYPYLDRIIINGENRNQREYRYLPGSFEYPLIEAQENLHVSLLLHPEKIKMINFPESEILRNSFSLIDSVTIPRISPFREYTVVDGMIRRFREDSNFDGQFDRVVLLNDWLPFEGYRDIDGDGEFDLKEKYVSGRFSGFEYEGEMGRLEEIQDLWNRRRFQLWDFSKDGFYNALLEQKDDGSWVERILDTKSGQQ
ncbi:hypothetical protein EXM22_07020 [Oceanispirochaeta crateris]|uniref:Tetratricopeptide repeat protein n=1 Tax=Oceanispirochaeta crateris TaxID=2518645 RepID=A0A5C1QJJ0_9SPIO|nr:hypothetical protein [Oceanispirochaeta crateris]QEN07751.1 hypothetical protein EXM22_07020 [Oceanispirochaeta crateris]